MSTPNVTNEVIDAGLPLTTMYNRILKKSLLGSAPAGSILVGNRPVDPSSYSEDGIFLPYTKEVVKVNSAMLPDNCVTGYSLDRANTVGCLRAGMLGSNLFGTSDFVGAWNPNTMAAFTKTASNDNIQVLFSHQNNTDNFFKLSFTNTCSWTQQTRMQLAIANFSSLVWSACVSVSGLNALVTLTWSYNSDIPARMTPTITYSAGGAITTTDPITGPEMVVTNTGGTWTAGWTLRYTGGIFYGDGNLTFSTNLFPNTKAIRNWYWTR